MLLVNRVLVLELALASVRALGLALELVSLLYFTLLSNRLTLSFLLESFSLRSICSFLVCLSLR